MKEYEMTKEQLDKLIDSCKPTPSITLQCGEPKSRQETANIAWKSLGKKMRFDCMTVKPNGKGNRFFTAEPLEDK